MCHKIWCDEKFKSFFYLNVVDSGGSYPVVGLAVHPVVSYHGAQADRGQIDDPAGSSFGMCPTSTISRTSRSVLKQYLVPLAHL